MAELSKSEIRKLWEQTKIIYLGTQTITANELSTMTGLPEDEISFKIMGENGKGRHKDSWYYIKSHITDASIISVMTNQKNVIEMTGKVALNIISTSLQRLNQKLSDETGMIISIDDMSKIATIFEKMDKIVRLDNGQATEIVKSMKLSYEQKVKISKVIGNDPFLEPAVDVESKVVSEGLDEE